MSRSKKKFPISWYKLKSAKRYKRIYNRMLRRVSKQFIKQDKELLFSIRGFAKELRSFKIGKTVMRKFKIYSYKDYLK